MGQSWQLPRCIQMITYTDDYVIRLILFNMSSVL